MSGSAGVAGSPDAELTDAGMTDVVRAVAGWWALDEAADNPPVAGGFRTAGIHPTAVVRSSAGSGDTEPGEHSNSVSDTDARCGRTPDTCGTASAHHPRRRSLGLPGYSNPSSRRSR